jgi:hypothetical protein
MLFGKSFRVVSSTIVVAILLTGCAQNDTKQNTSNSKISATPMPTTALNYDGELLLANTDVEREFLTQAIASCKRAQTDGFVLTYPEGQSIFKPAATGKFPDWPFDEVSIVDGKAQGAFFNNDLPAFFSPCNLEVMAQRTEAGAPLLEHKIVRNSSNSYTWYQHNGGNELDGVTYEFTDGLISGYEVNGAKSTVNYGPLTEEQLNLFG